MKVKDIMEPLRNWLLPEMTVLEAIQVMRHTKRGHGLSVNGIVVLDHDMRLVGIVSTKDILRLLIPSYLYLDDAMDTSTWEGMRAERTEMARSVSVREIMTEDVRTVSSTESIARCADMMLVEQLRRLPVVGIDGRVMGVVYLRDLYNAMTNMLCNAEAGAPSS